MWTFIIILSSSMKIRSVFNLPCLIVRGGDHFSIFAIYALYFLLWPPSNWEYFPKNSNSPVYFHQIYISEGKTINPFHATDLFWYPWKHQKTRGFIRKLLKEISGMKWVKLKLLAQKQKQSKKLSSAIVRTKKLKEHKINTQKNKTLGTLC